MASNRKFIIYEVLFYWRTEKGLLKSFYKIGYTSYRIDQRFSEEIRNGLKIFVTNLREEKLYEEATALEEKLLKLARISNKEEFEQYE